MSWICQAGLSAYPKVGGIKMGRRHQVQSMLSVVTTIGKYPLPLARMLLPALMFPKEGPSHLVSLLSPHEVEFVNIGLLKPNRQSSNSSSPLSPAKPTDTRNHHLLTLVFLIVPFSGCGSGTTAVYPYCLASWLPSHPFFSHHHHQPPCPSFFLRFFGPPNHPSHSCPLGHALFLSATCAPF